MKTIKTPSRASDGVLETDVLVVGSGPGRARPRGPVHRHRPGSGACGGKCEPQSLSPCTRIPTDLARPAVAAGVILSQPERGIFPEFTDGYGILIIPTTGRYFDVPYRSLVPKGIGNLLVAGRFIGGDRVSHAAVRKMMCCVVSGQGAGVAAAISSSTGRAFDRLDVGSVQTQLRRQGARIQ